MAEKAALLSRRRIVVAGLVGNVMEWYDFAVYGYFATVIGSQFFPSDDPAVSLIAAFGAFAAGFLVRPLEGLVFGRIGDVVGRRRALTVSVLAMALPTVLIAFLPPYRTIGIAAPIVLVALRIVQGLSGPGPPPSTQGSIGGWLGGGAGWCELIEKCARLSRWPEEDGTWRTRRLRRSGGVSATTCRRRRWWSAATCRRSRWSPG